MRRICVRGRALQFPDNKSNLLVRNQLVSTRKQACVCCLDVVFFFLFRSAVFVLHFLSVCFDRSVQFLFNLRPKRDSYQNIVSSPRLPRVWPLMRTIGTRVSKYGAYSPASALQCRSWRGRRDYKIVVGYYGMRSFVCWFKITKKNVSCAPLPSAVPCHRCFLSVQQMSTGNKYTLSIHQPTV